MNRTAGAVRVFENDVPNFQGLDATGETVIIELYGKWDFIPPAGQPRPNELMIQPGQTLDYTITTNRRNELIGKVKYWHVSADGGHMFLAFDFDGPYWNCPAPQSPDSAASIPATNLPPVK